MVSEGRITAEEADQLIAVLQDVEAAEANLEAAGSGRSTAHGSQPERDPQEPPIQPSPPASEAPQAPQPIQDQLPPQAPSYQPPPSTAPQPPSSSASGTRSDPVAESVREALHEAREAARGARREAREAARDAARQARDAARQASRIARDAARDASREASRVARDTSREVSAAVSGIGRFEVEDIDERPGSAIAPEGTPWVIVEMIGGDLDIAVDDTLDGPVAEGGPGNVEIERDQEGFRVRFMPDRGNIIDRFLSSVRSGDLNIRIPPHFGVSIEATAGDVDLHGVRYLRGRLRAGDVSADVLQGVDFALMAGEFDATLDLWAGEHVVTVGAGEAQVALRDDANVSVSGRVSIGDLDAHLPELQQRGQGLGGEVAGTIGDGAANLRLRVTTGDLTIRRARPASNGNETRTDRG